MALPSVLAQCGREPSSQAAGANVDRSRFEEFRLHFTSAHEASGLGRSTDEGRSRLAPQQSHSPSRVGRWAGSLKHIELQGGMLRPWSSL